jgi:hypothetical protein
MANELYNNTYEKDITANILLKTGLDYSEIAMLLASQVSNCIKLVLRGQQIWIEQVTALAVDLSNKECFEASISYTYCGRTLVYKAKLNITYAPNCVAPILHTITYASGSFTITGQIANSYLEYSTNNGTTWTRLPTPYPDTTSITTSLLPTNIDLKVRMVAVCDETKISNVLDYNYVAPVIPILTGGISNLLVSNVGGCDEPINTIAFFGVSNLSFLQIGDSVYNTNDDSDPFMGNGNTYKIRISDALWDGISDDFVVTISNLGQIQTIQIC